MSDVPLIIDQWAGTSPVIISIPHAGVGLPTALKERMTEQARLLPDTDWHVEKLYDFAPDMDVTVIKANISRYVIDLNRDPAGSSLYPGQSVTELCPTTTFDDDPIYQEGQMPDAAEIIERVFYYHQPYHGLLKAEIARIKALHGYCIVLDAHSIRSHVERFFTGRLPHFNWGTNDGTTCAPKITEMLESYHRSASYDFTSVTNGRFKGGYITRHYGYPLDGVHTIQLELAQCAYMDESPPYNWDIKLSDPLKGHLSTLVKNLIVFDLKS